TLLRSEGENQSGAKAMHFGQEPGNSKCKTQNANDVSLRSALFAFRLLHFAFNGASLVSEAKRPGVHRFCQIGLFPSPAQSVDQAAQRIPLARGLVGLRSD